MKTNKVLNKLILVILFGISGCVQDDEFSIPHTLGIEERKEALQKARSISQIIESRYLKRTS